MGATDFRWTEDTTDPKGATSLTCRSGPLTMRLQKKGDGRWSWHVFKDGADSAMATGLATSIGSAKSVAQQFAARTGLV